LIHPFQQVFKVVESALPEAGHLARPVDKRRQGAELRAVVRLATFVAIAYESCLLQRPEMLRHGWLRDASRYRQRPDRLLSFAAQAFENRAPRRIGKGPEKYVVSGGRHI
jgi:hypothetical protein